MAAWPGRGIISPAAWLRPAQAHALSGGPSACGAHSPGAGAVRKAGGLPSTQPRRRRSEGGRVPAEHTAYFGGLSDCGPTGSDGSDVLHQASTRCEPRRLHLGGRPSSPSPGHLPSPSRGTEVFTSCSGHISCHSEPTQRLEVRTVAVSSCDSQGRRAPAPSTF